MKKIILITGGDNNERPISLQSAEAVHDALITLGYEVTQCDYPQEKDVLINVLKKGEYDFARVMIHGVGGEDGEVQQLLDQYNLPSQTANVDALQLTIDKYLTKLERKKAGLPVARGLIIDSLVNDVQEVHRDILQKISYPCIAKDTHEGSSFGIKILENEADLRERWSTKDPQRQYLIEQFLRGKEITVPVRDGDDDCTTLPPILIDHGQPFWTYDSKYDPATTELCPAPLDEDTLETITTLACQAYDAVGMSAYGRVDMILTNNGPVLLEINTIPGFTQNSLFPKSAAVGGYDFVQVVEKLTRI